MVDNIELMTPVVRMSATSACRAKRRCGLRTARGSPTPAIEVTATWALWVIGADGSSPRQLTFPVLTPPAGMNGDSTGASSPDGSRIAYSSVVGGDRELYVMNADGSGQRRITTWRGDDSPNVWLPDGRIVFGHSARSAPLPRWYLVRADGTGLRSLPWLYGASDPLDWWLAHP